MKRQNEKKPKPFYEEITKNNDFDKGLRGWIREQEGRIGYVLLWALGVPLPILIIIYLIRGH